MTDSERLKKIDEIIKGCFKFKKEKILDKTFYHIVYRGYILQTTKEMYEILSGEEQAEEEIKEVTRKIIKYEKDRVYLFNIFPDNTIFKIDLTSFFGKGNEPTDINDERLEEIKDKEYRR